MNRLETFQKYFSSNPNLSNSAIFRKMLSDKAIKEFSTVKTYESYYDRRKDQISKSETSLSVQETKNNSIITAITELRIKTLEDLIKVCEIDTNVWEIERWVCNKWEMGERGGNTTQLFQVKAWLKKNSPLIELQDIKEEIKSELKKYSPKVPKVKYKIDTNSKMLQVNLMDVHFGKHTWGKETGNDYDIKIAEEMLLIAVERLIEQAKPYKIDSVLLIVGNDFFNVDNQLNTTTRGTFQSEDTRSKKTFKLGRKLWSSVIDRLTEIGKVYVEIVVGNHDETRTFYLGDALECYYHNNPNVLIDNSPATRKYFTYGKCLIGLTHGKDEKIKDLPLIMAQEKPDLWGKTKYREWHLGDKHHKKEIWTMGTEDNMGVVIRLMRSLSSTDEWHYKKGYIGNIRSAEAFIWDKERGVISQFFANI